MAEINESIKKGTGFREELAFEFSFFISKLKETIVDAAGIGWLFEKESAKKVCDFFACLVLVYVRWWIKLAIFIGIIYLVVALVFPHTGTKF